MVRRFLPVLLALLVTTILLAGCGQQAAGSAGTPAATTVPATTITGTTMVTEATPAPVTTPPEPFPGALSMGTPYTYGREDISTEITVYRVKTLTGYEWYSPQWGRYWNTTPKEGNHFILAFVRLTDRGTARARLPSPSMFALQADGSSYLETTDRDNSLRIKDIAEKQYEYFYERTGGWLDPGTSNRVEGFLIYEVPDTITPDRAYLEATLSSQANAVWKLG